MNHIIIKEDRITETVGPSSGVCEAALLNEQHALPCESEKAKIWKKTFVESCERMTRFAALDDAKNETQTARGHHSSPFFDSHQPNIKALHAQQPHLTSI